MRRVRYIGSQTSTHLNLPGTIIVLLFSGRVTGYIQIRIIGPTSINLCRKFYCESISRIVDLIVMLIHSQDRGR